MMSLPAQCATLISNKTDTEREREREREREVQVKIRGATHSEVTNNKRGHSQ